MREGLVGAAELEVEWNKRGPVSLSLLEGVCALVSTHMITSDLLQVSSVEVEPVLWCMLVNEKRSVLCTQDPGDSKMLTAEQWTVLSWDCQHIHSHLIPSQICVHMCSSKKTGSCIGIFLTRFPCWRVLNLHNPFQCKPTHCQQNVGNLCALWTTKRS